MQLHRQSSRKGGRVQRGRKGVGQGVVGGGFRLGVRNRVRGRGRGRHRQVRRGQRKEGKRVSGGRFRLGGRGLTTQGVTIH